MDVLEQLQEDLRDGRLDAARLLELMATLQHKLQTAHQRIAELEQQLANPCGPQRFVIVFRSSPKSSGLKSTTIRLLPNWSTRSVRTIV